jgi:cytochrome P450
LTVSGPVVRISPSKVSFNTSTALQTIYGNRRAPIAKGGFYATIRTTAQSTETTFSTANEATHTFKRRILSHAFSERAIHDYEQHVSTNIDKWLDCLGKGPVDEEGWTKEGKNVADWINYLTMDILTDLAYGKSFDLLGKEDMRFVTELLPNATFGTYVVSPIWHWLLAGQSGGLRKLLFYAMVSGELT